MIRRVALLTTLALFVVFSPVAIAADAGITIISSHADVCFPSRIVFTVEAESSASIVDVRLCYQVDKMNYAEVVSEGWADFTPASRVRATWTWDMTNASLPPGAEVRYWWVLEDSMENKLESSQQIVHFDDTRYSWQSLSAAVPQGGNLTLFWYTGSGSFAQELMNTCQQGLARLTQYIGAYPERPIRIFVYASTGDLQGAMIYPQEWSGGVAFTEFSIIAIAIAPSELDWGRKALVHELAHLVVHQATFGPYGRLPVWLDEGLAMYSEGELDPVFGSYLEEAILKNELVSVRSLCSPFSAYSDKARLSYAESYSLVEYLLDNYGRDKMLDLLTLLKEGSTYDEALTQVYGFDIDGLDVRWRATLASHSVIASEGWQSHRVLVAVLAALATGLALWGGLALKKRVSGKSSGKSVM
jgi:hypothetical protein